MLSNGHDCATCCSELGLQETSASEPQHPSGSTTSTPPPPHPSTSTFPPSSNPPSPACPAVLVVGEAFVPHGYVLPRVSLLLHHGGLGTTSTCIRYGFIYALTQMASKMVSASTGRSSSSTSQCLRTLLIYPVTYAVLR